MSAAPSFAALVGGIEDRARAAPATFQAPGLARALGGASSQWADAGRDSRVLGAVNDRLARSTVQVDYDDGEFRVSIVDRGLPTLGQGRAAEHAEEVIRTLGHATAGGLRMPAPLLDAVIRLVLATR